MYNIVIMGDGKTTHETSDIKAAKAFIITAIRNAKDLAKLSITVSEQA